MNNERRDSTPRAGGLERDREGQTVAESGAEPRDAFPVFVAQRWTSLVRFGYLLTGDWAASEDLVQTALERSWRRWDHVHSQRPEQYVKAAMANQMRSCWRSPRPDPLSLADLPEAASGSAPTGDHSVDHALREVIWTELLRLPPRMRAIVVLRVWEDPSEAETTALLGVSTGSVKSQMSRAMTRLRAQPGVLEAAGRAAPITIGTQPLTAEAIGRAEGLGSGIQGEREGQW